MEQRCGYIVHRHHLHRLLVLGIAYELSDEEIAKYMDVESKNFTDVDLRRISVMLGIELPKE